jgi:hypothetical protein
MYQGGEVGEYDVDWGTFLITFFFPPVEREPLQREAGYDHLLDYKLL